MSKLEVLLSVVIFAESVALTIALLSIKDLKERLEMYRDSAYRVGEERDAYEKCLDTLMESSDLTYTLKEISDGYNMYKVVLSKPEPEVIYKISTLTKRRK